MSTSSESVLLSSTLSRRSRMPSHCTSIGTIAVSRSSSTRPSRCAAGACLMSVPSRCSAALRWFSSCSAATSASTSRERTCTTLGVLAWLALAFCTSSSSPADTASKTVTSVEVDGTDAAGRAPRPSAANGTPPGSMPSPLGADVSCCSSTDRSDVSGMGPQSSPPTSVSSGMSGTSGGSVISSTRSEFMLQSGAAWRCARTRFEVPGRAPCWEYETTVVLRYLKQIRMGSPT